MDAKARKAFTSGYVAGMRSMLMSINNGEPGDFVRGSDPYRINFRDPMSQRLIDKIIQSTSR